MKRAILFAFVAVLAIGGALAAFRPFSADEPSLSRFAPAGALLYLEAKDFSTLLAAWNGSAQKKQWLHGDNYQIFSQSRLFLRLKEASDQFAAAAGLPADMKFVSQVAGAQSAVALYDIGKLQFLYVTKIGSASSVHTALWESRMKFETRITAGTTFYLRRDPESEREVAFAVDGDYLLLATREDLIAGALQLMAGSKDQTTESEPWWNRSVSSAGPAGDLRLVLNLEKIVPSPYFRSYWIQKNITEMKQYSAAVSDFFLAGQEYREERVLVKASPSSNAETTADGSAAVADLARLVPADAGVYQLRANPTAAETMALLETKILAPHSRPALPYLYAPQVQLTSGQTGSATDLETRIDQPPVETHVDVANSTSLKSLLEKNPQRASLQLQNSYGENADPFVRFHSVLVFAGGSDWNESSVRAALTDFVRPSLTTTQLGLSWEAKSGYQVLDGLWPLALAVRGKIFIVSDDPATTAALVARLGQKSSEKPALLVAGFNHARERQPFRRLTRQLDGQSAGANVNNIAPHAPEFFSDNVGSLSSALAGVSAEKVVVRDAGDKVLQTVTYAWAQ
jgi:hypothetical protein